jgi:hypothetical protein
VLNSFIAGFSIFFLNKNMKNLSSFPKSRRTVSQLWRILVRNYTVQTTKKEEKHIIQLNHSSQHKAGHEF